MEKIRNIKLFKNYYKEFYVAQTFEVRDKINKVLKLIETQRIIPAKFFRIIEGTDGIYEIRIELGNNIHTQSRVYSDSAQYGIKSEFENLSFNW